MQRHRRNPPSRHRGSQGRFRQWFVYGGRCDGAKGHRQIVCGAPFEMRQEHRMSFLFEAAVSLLLMGCMLGVTGPSRWR